jgi:hypothetical protein
LNTILDFNSTLEFSPLVDEVHKNFFLSWGLVPFSVFRIPGLTDEMVASHF